MCFYFLGYIYSLKIGVSVCSSWPLCSILLAVIRDVVILGCLFVFLNEGLLINICSWNDFLCHWVGRLRRQHLLRMWVESSRLTAARSPRNCQKKNSLTLWEEYYDVYPSWEKLSISPLCTSTMDMQLPGFALLFLALPQGFRASLCQSFSSVKNHFKGFTYGRCLHWLLWAGEDCTDDL